ncbi:gliding motility protein GldC [Sphingobacterium sp. FBM7-1]|uniref:gliding motility protein GldC n=1 Tax=Sphingobacterium sp. FBM7-1 TaxID=2886688 RepID=UPI001D113F4D|nr:gliding motility protein GldC [Sphingobacterium sp. FBM7-1]MCC2599722.1 gliding motility protein GldC [Sphingobacterium sp. FBM7-1]
MKQAEIKLNVILDEQNVPERIDWSSTDGESSEEMPSKAMFLALWDAQYKNSLRIDLWTKDMPYDEMKRFFYETLQTLGDSFLRAAGGDPMADKVIGDLRDYCAHFAEKMEVLEEQK